jgi:hypothetical protein
MVRSSAGSRREFSVRFGYVLVRARGGFGLLMCAVLVVAPSAAAQRAEITQQIFDEDGLPLLVANPVPNGNRGQVVAWRMCPPAGACAPVATSGADDRTIEPGDVPAGTSFEVDVVSDSGEKTTARSSPWLGRVTAVTAPAVTGTLRVGRHARPVAATWTGGWPGDRDLLRLEACASPSGRRCETLSAQGEDPPVCPGGAAVLGRRYAGWWVRAVDQRVAADAAFAGVGYDLPRDIPLAQPSRTTVRSELVGPVLRPSGAFAECARPQIAILARVRRESQRRVFARVQCTTACDVLLVVRDARRAIRRRGEPRREGEVGLPARTRLIGPRVDVRVVVNGRHRAHRRVLLG